ncbi:PIH1 domain-containing protein 1-like [Microtus oregoni]|uniref:PIH1 domain-containing protein 1-like n=1 Tax=Microtus oregoni TaxID=111838 RepID=UPI001BB1A081|nr:PIH1 domain-containing protein 1-like [Microtus oregoni]
MAESKLLAPELSDAESMGDETVRFQEMLLQASKELQQAQMERSESTQIRPQPGFCIKTNSSEGKVFINICHSPSIPPPVDVTEDELLQMLEEDQAGFRIPMSLGEPHAELDASQYPQKTPSLFPQDPAILRSFQSGLGARAD